MLKTLKRFVDRVMPSFSTRQWRLIWEGYQHNQACDPCVGGPPSLDPSNPLREYFDSHKEGRGIWKWNHYFDIYHRHFSKFRGREVNILEIGIYSGGSLDMWKHYFGPRSHVYGVDIEPACKAYEDDSVTVFVGDQADRTFWQHVKKQAPAIDIVIDDGGHQAQQQIVTLEELLPHMRPGGVYLCEDVHGAFSGFASYMSGFIHNLNECGPSANNVDNPDRRIVCKATPFHSAIRSVHFYPFVAVIEKGEGTLSEFVSPKRGTQWQPFLK
jgi:23S rRNA U2552 (ribose-2'-O)-methylase RlmE/FtsJ